MTLPETVDVSICNMALSHIGETARVTSIDPPDGSAQAARCAQFYATVRDELLAARRWSFALKRAALTATTMPWTEWDFAYLLPSDVLHVFAVHPPDATDDYTQTPYTTGTPAGAVPKDFVVELDSAERPVLYTDVEDAVIRYVPKITDATLFSPAFRLALSWKLASLLAGPIIKGQAGAEEARRCLQMAEYHLGKADVVDATQRRVNPEHTVTWMNARS